MTPAYPVLKLSHVSGIVKAEMSLFNSREDVSYYQIEVFDLNWNNLPFSTTYKIMRVDYKERRDFDVYIRKSDLDIATYICSTSKVKRKSGAQTLISSRICSKINGDAA